MQPNMLSMDPRALQTGRYARHIIVRGFRRSFAILSIVWGPDQFRPSTPIIPGAPTRVHENELQETLYAVG